MHSTTAFPVLIHSKDHSVILIFIALEACLELEVNRPWLCLLFRMFRISSCHAAVQIFVDDGLSGGAIGGIVAGAVGFLLLVMALVIFLLYKRRKRRRAKRYTAENLERIQKRYGSSDLGSGQNGIELQSSGVAASVMPMNGESTRLRGAHSQKSMLSSPFGGASGPVTLGSGSASNGANGGVGNGSHESVELPRALLPSPFGMETGLSGPRTATTLTTLKSIDETTSTTGNLKTKRSSCAPSALRQVVLRAVMDPGCKSWHDPDGDLGANLSEAIISLVDVQKNNVLFRRSQYLQWSKIRVMGSAATAYQSCRPYSM